MCNILQNAAKYWRGMARFMGKKLLEKSNRNKANRLKNRSNFSIDQIF